MADIQKYTYKQACSLNANHIARDDENNRETHRNEDIDNSRTHDNYSLLDRNMNDRQYLKQRLSEVAVLNRADVKASANIIITAPKEVPRQYQKAFFGECLAWAQARYGEKNVWQAWVHNDETTPHLHLGVIPVSKNVTKKQANKGYTEKLSFDDVFSKRNEGGNEYNKLHASLQEHMLRSGIPGADKVVNGATAKAGGNRSVRELKAERDYQHAHKYDHLRDR